MDNKDIQRVFKGYFLKHFSPKRWTKKEKYDRIIS